MLFVCCNAWIQPSELNLFLLDMDGKRLPEISEFPLKFKITKC